MLLDTFYLNNMKDTFNETENRLKYGAKENDIISQMFAISLNTGLSFCLGNALKYITRYESQSEKGNNPADLYKFKDYIQRCIEVCESDISYVYFGYNDSLNDIITSYTFGDKDYKKMITEFLTQIAQ